MSEKALFRLFGIFGYPLSHTLSPAMQEAAFAATGLKAFYVALELGPKAFRKALSHSQKLVLDGFNITVPYKSDVIRYLDRVTPEAKAVGAVNTVFRKGRQWIGANTDVDGFLRSLREEAHFNPKNKNALVFGAGGAARAVVYGLAKSGAKKIVVVNRHKDRARQLIRDFQRLFPRAILSPSLVILRPEGPKGLRSFASLRMTLKEADLVVNATSLGLMKSDPEVIPASLIPKAGEKKLFFDLIYHVPQTNFMKSAAWKGHRVLGGLGMLLFQGAEAFEYWTGKKAPVGVMRRALVQALQQQEKA